MKQQVISRFFAPKSQTNDSTSNNNETPSTSSSPNPKISATVKYTPSKRPSNSQQPPFNPPLPTPSLHQKFLQKLLEPPDSSLQASERYQLSSGKLTPLETQVVELKKKHPDVLLMIEVGYKFRFFGEDAETAARVLGIYAHMDHSFLTASVPTFRLNVHVRRLVNAGYKVGVVKQTETAAIKAHGANKLGPFTRGLSALYTRATLEAAEDIGGEEEGCGSSSNYLVCVVEENVDVEDRTEVKIGIVAVETSTGDVVHGEFVDGFMRSGLEAVILSLAPAELLLADPLSKETNKFLCSYAGAGLMSNHRMERTSRECFKGGGALAEVMSLFEELAGEFQCGESMELEAQGKHQESVKAIVSMPGLVVKALALMTRHLKQFGLEKILCMGSSFRTLSSNVEMTLSANTLQQLEILKNNSNGSECGSLLQIMNHTLTASGSRLLRHWVTHPLSDRNCISARLDAVSEIAQSMGTSTALEDVDSGVVAKDSSDIMYTRPKVSCVISSVLTTLGRSPDIQRGVTRIFHWTATPSEFIAVMESILHAGKQLQQFHLGEDTTANDMLASTMQSNLLRKLFLLASSPRVTDYAAKSLSALNREAADKKDLSNLFVKSSGQFPEVSQAQASVEQAKEKLESLIFSYRKKFRMSSLEFISVSGTTHLIELPADTRTPSDWVKVNSTKKTIRYHPPEVVTLLDDLTLATEELTIICRTAWDGFLQKFGNYYAEFQSAVQAIASLDCLHSLAILSRNKDYTRPDFVGDSEPVQIIVSSGRHPVLDMAIQDSFVPNDTNLHSEGEYCQVVTGPNMGGKSCYIRQVALLAIMAQVGSYVPASSMKLHVLDSIHTRMGASDNIQLGRSTFLEELSEASHILKYSTQQSLVIIDELGRGTSTHDGVAIAYAALHYLLEQKKCMVLFVTHYPSIIEIRNKFSGSVGAYHVSYLTSDMNPPGNSNDESTAVEDVTYLYKLAPGIAERSFGFKVAQLAQIPSTCIQQAMAMAERLETVVRWRVETRSSKRCLLDAPTHRENSKRTRVSYAGGNESIEGVLDDLKEFFSTVHLLVKGHSSDDAESVQHLCHSRRLSKELTTRLSRML